MTNRPPSDHDDLNTRQSQPQFLPPNDTLTYRLIIDPTLPDGGFALRVARNIDHIDTDIAPDGSVRATFYWKKEGDE